MVRASREARAGQDRLQFQNRPPEDCRRLRAAGNPLRFGVLGLVPALGFSENRAGAGRFGVPLPKSHSPVAALRRRPVMRLLLAYSLVLIVPIGVPPAPRSSAGDDKTEVPKPVRDLVGTYVGAWTV